MQAHLLQTVLLLLHVVALVLHQRCLVLELLQNLLQVGVLVLAGAELRLKPA